MAKRICLFAGFNQGDVIQNYVLDYLRELTNYADVYYFADNELPISELDKVKQIVINAWSKPHRKYDFGSYSELANNYVGWEEIEKYDELIFANDSCFCLQSFDCVFKKMDSSTADFWGLTATDDNNISNDYSFDQYCKFPKAALYLFSVNSYFIVFRKRIINDNGFREFLERIDTEPNRLNVCYKYEIGLTHFLMDKGYKASVFVDVVYKFSFIYGLQAFRLLKANLPLIKIRIFKDNPLNISDLNDWIGFVARITDKKIYNYLATLNQQPITLLPNSSNISILRRGKRYIKKILRHGINLKHRIKEGVIIGQSISSYSLRQKKLINDIVDAKKLNIFFNVADDCIAGGMLSINRFVDNSIKLQEQYQFTVVVSGVPQNNPVVEYSFFEGRLPMVDFQYITTILKPKEVIINLPEVFVTIFLNQLTSSQAMWLKTIHKLQINILNQNDLLMPSPVTVNECKLLADSVTITMAHERYCTQSIADRYNVAVSTLTPFLPDFYRLNYQQKENIIVLSPDNDVFTNSEYNKKLLIKKITTNLPSYKVVIIKHPMKFEHYKEIIAKAKFTITFGEGYDGYFIEPYLSNSIAFAVYNSIFFPKEFSDMPTVYNSIGDLFENLVQDIVKYDSDVSLYERTSHLLESIIQKYTNNDRSIKELNDFYAGNYLYYPSALQ